MPNPEKVRRAWGLPEEGAIIDNFKVEKAEIGHIMVSRYRKYKYPIDYILEGNGNLKEIGKIFSIGKTAEVKTSYGNPYTCEITDIKVEKLGRGKIRIKGNGICVRDFTHKKD